MADSSLLARGAVFAVEGTALGPGDVQNAATPYPNDISGASIALTAADGSATVQAYMVQAGATLLLAILPSSTPSGDYTLTATYNGETSEAVKVKVADRNFGLVTITGNPGGPAMGRARVPGADPVAVTYITSAKPGQTLELDAAGVGPIESADNDSPPELNQVEGGVLMIAGTEAPITYLGRNPQRPGYDRIVVTLPESGLPSSCQVEMYLRIGSFVSSRFVLPLSTAEKDVCTHPCGFTPDGLRRLVEGGSIVYGAFTLSQQALSAECLPIDMKTEIAGGSFTRYNAVELANFMAGDGSANYTLNPNGCSIFTASEVPSAPTVSLDAGASLKLTGPDSLNKDLPRGKANEYSATLPAPGGSIPGLPPGIPGIPGLPGGGSNLKKGAFSLTGTGGADVGAFAAQLQANDAITWTNRDAITIIDRSTDLTLLWTGGVQGDLVDAIGISHGLAPEDPARTVTRVFVCMAPAEAGKIVVPSSILQQMPAVAASADCSQTDVGMLSLNQTNGPTSRRFQAPLTAGGQTEPSLFTINYGLMRMLGYK